MAKRFTDTDLFKKKFIRGLQGAYKLLWIYIYHDCNHAGIWETDFEVASIRIDYPLDITEALTNFGNRVIPVGEDNEKWFIPSFIEFQYGGLNPENRAHNSVIKILSKYKIDYKTLTIKGHTSPLQGAMDMDKDKDKDMDKEFEYLKNKDFSNLWDDYLEMRKKIRKPATSKARQLALNKLVNLSNNNIGTAILLIEQSIMNSWQGIFPLKEDFKTKNKLNSYGERYPEYFHADGTPREL